MRVRFISSTEKSASASGTNERPSGPGYMIGERSNNRHTVTRGTGEEVNINKVTPEVNESRGTEFLDEIRGPFGCEMLSIRVGLQGRTTVASILL